jgi:hypothetical protein
MISESTTYTPTVEVKNQLTSLRNYSSLFPAFLTEIYVPSTYETISVQEFCIILVRVVCPSYLLALSKSLSHEISSSSISFPRFLLLFDLARLSPIPSQINTHPSSLPQPSTITIHQPILNDLFNQPPRQMSTPQPTQILYLSIPKSQSLKDDNNPNPSSFSSSQSPWSKALDILQQSPGFVRCYWGRCLEEDERVQVHVGMLFKSHFLISGFLFLYDKR